MSNAVLYLAKNFQKKQINLFELSLFYPTFAKIEYNN